MKENLLNTENGVLESSISQDKVNNSNLYLDETDSKGVPLLRRVEKYPDLPENEFIPIEYTHSNGLKILNGYSINKLGEIRSNYGNKLLNGYKSLRNYRRIGLKLLNGDTYSLFIHRLVASTFLVNPNPDLYNVVNHIDHNPENNNSSNLEWTTYSENNNKENGKSSLVDNEKLTQYIALNDQGDEMFRLTRRDDISKIYRPDSIVTAIKRNEIYKGYYWKIENKKEYIIYGFSGNLDDYEWHEHWKYPGILYVCKESFIKYNDKITYSIDSGGYVSSYFVQDNIKYNKRAHRLIMEYILGRDLEDGEIIDHINTIRHDNSFSNLRVTDFKGNRNNPLTVEKLSKKLILTDLYGNFISYDTSKNLNRIIYKNSNRFKDFRDLIRDIFLADNYFCIKIGDKETLYKKMGKVVYVFNKDKTEILGAYRSGVDASGHFQLSKYTINDRIKDGKPAIDGNYYLRGPEAVKLVLSLGYGTAGDFKPE